MARQTALVSVGSTALYLLLQLVNLLLFLFELLLQACHNRPLTRYPPAVATRGQPVLEILNLCVGKDKTSRCLAKSRIKRRATHYTIVAIDLKLVNAIDRKCTPL